MKIGDSVGEVSLRDSDEAAVKLDEETIHVHGSTRFGDLQRVTQPEVIQQDGSTWNRCSEHYITIT